MASAKMSARTKSARVVKAKVARGQRASAVIKATSRVAAKTPNARVTK